MTAGEDRHLPSNKFFEGKIIKELVSQLGEKENLIELTIYPSSVEQSEITDISAKELPLRLLKTDFPLPKLLTKSFLSFYTLFLLLQEPKYGNEILNWLKEKSELWSASPGTIYPLLRQMEEEKLVKGYWEPGIKRPCHIYEITDRGKEAFEKLRESVLPQLQKSLCLLNQLIKETQDSRR